MKSADTVQFFDAIAGRYDRVYAVPARETRRRMRPILAELPAPPSCVLDLGVGTGRELPCLLDAGHFPTGLDASPAMLERCARRARPIPLVCADFWRVPLPFAPRSFDATIALHGTLAHPPAASAVDALAKELARLVRPGGVLLVEVPSMAWLDAVGALRAAGRADERRVRRTGPQTCIFEDLVVGASIEARLLTEAEWRKALAPDWVARVEPLGDLEWLVVAERR
ncbi:MAG: class I SAM-dependent methyltransferase [Polyangiaceae bacterium]|jgi:SAM-dependent methyltransferase